MDYKLNVQHELDSRVLVRRSYEECFNEMQYLAMQPRKSYDYLVFLAHGARRFVNGKLERTILTFSDGVYDQHVALNEIAGLMVPSMGEHVIVSCFQTWNLKDTNKHFETFRLLLPRWTIKVAGSEGSVSFSPIKVEKVVL